MDRGAGGPTADDSCWGRPGDGNGHMPGSDTTLLSSARTPTVMMTCAHWPSKAWTSHRPLGPSGPWVPASSESSTQNLIDVTTALALPWPAEPSATPVSFAFGLSPELELTLGVLSAWAHAIVQGHRTWSPCLLYQHFLALRTNRIKTSCLQAMASGFN